MHVSSLWKDPRTRFVISMTLFGVLLWIVFRESIMGPVLTPMRALTAEGTRWLISLTGLDAVREANYVFHPSGFAMEITRGCTGFAGAAVLCAGIATYPRTPSGSRWTGILIGVPLFIAINLARMTHLYALGARGSPFFDVAHELVWQLGMMAAVFLIWMVWVIVAEGSEP